MKRSWCRFELKLAMLSLVPCISMLAAFPLHAAQFQQGTAIDQRLDAQRRYAFLIEKTRNGEARAADDRLLEQAGNFNRKIAKLSREADQLRSERDQARAAVKQNSKRISQLETRLANVEDERDAVGAEFVALVEVHWQTLAELDRSQYRDSAARALTFNELQDEPDRVRAMQLIADARFDEAQEALAYARKRSREEWTQLNAELETKQRPTRLNLAALLTRYKEDARFLSDRIARGELGSEALLALWDEAQLIAPDDISVMSNRAALRQRIGQPGALQLYQDVFDRAGKDNVFDLVMAYENLQVALRQQRPVNNFKWSAEEIALAQRLQQKLGEAPLSADEIARIEAAEDWRNRTEEPPVNYAAKMEDYIQTKYADSASAWVFGSHVHQVEHFAVKGPNDKLTAYWDLVEKGYSWLLSNPVKRLDRLKIEADWLRAQAAMAWHRGDKPMHWQLVRQFDDINKQRSQLDPKNLSLANERQWRLNGAISRASDGPFDLVDEQALTDLVDDEMSAVSILRDKAYDPHNLVWLKIRLDFVQAKLNTSEQLARLDDQVKRCRESFIRTHATVYFSCASDSSFSAMQLLAEKQDFAAVTRRLDDLDAWQRNAKISSIDRRLQEQATFWADRSRVALAYQSTGVSAALPTARLALQDLHDWYFSEPKSLADPALDHPQLYRDYLGLLYVVAEATDADQDWARAISAYDKAIKAGFLSAANYNPEAIERIESIRKRLGGVGM